jgi:hypothetical protein
MKRRMKAGLDRGETIAHQFPQELAETGLEEDLGPVNQQGAAGTK